MRNLSVWTRHDPFAEFDALIRHAFEDAPAGRSYLPAAESYRDGEDAVVRLELPGVDVADVTVEVVRGRLVVKGERKNEWSEERDARTVREMRYGTFARSFTLPGHVTADAVSASYDKGILTVRVAGAYRDETARRIAISAN